MIPVNREPFSREAPSDPRASLRAVVARLLGPETYDTDPICATVNRAIVETLVRWTQQA